MDEPASLLEASEGASGAHPKPASQDVLVMTVEIGDGRQDMLYVKEADDPSDLANEFAAKHQLDEATTALLVDLIRQNKDMARKKVAKSSEPRPVAVPSEKESKLIEVDSFRPKVRTKASEKGSVYDRLYQRSSKKKPAPEKPRSASVSKSEGPNFNYGEWLYIRGMQSRESLKRSAQTKKQEELHTQEKELTFRPTINRKSALLSPRYNMRTEDLLLQKEASKKEKLGMMKSQSEAELLKECSFNPKINARSAQLDVSRSSVSSQPRFVDLFQEATKRKERQLTREEEAVKSEFSFRPEVRGPKVEVDKEAFLDRIVNSKKRFEEEMEKIRREMVTDVDEHGQKMFEPQVNKEAKFERSLEAGTVHEHLYQQKDHKKSVLERLSQELDENIKAAQRSTKVTQNSERILENFRRKAYDSLFKLLDSDRDGFVSAAAMDVDAIEEKTAQIIAPVLTEIEARSDQVDFSEFHTMMDKLLSRLTLDAKSHILRKETKNEDQSASQMKRSLSVRSDQLASKRREGLPADIYSRRMIEKKQTEEKMELMKRDLELRELQKCTFKPFTTRSRGRKES